MSPEPLDTAEAMAPGWALIRVCEQVASDQLDAAGLVRLNRLWERAASWLAARQMATQAAALGAAGGCSQAQDDVVGELATSTHLSELSIGIALGHAVAVSSTLTRCAAALAEGLITAGHAKALARATGVADPGLAARVDAAVIPTAIERGLTPHQLRKAAERVLLALDPDGCAERAARAKRADSDVRYRSYGSGMAELTATGDELLLRQVADAIHARAAHGPDETSDPDPVGVRRVRALVELVLGPDQAARPRVEVIVTIDWRALLGLTDTPAVVSGVGPVPAHLARLLATDATWRRMITDPATGHLIDLGHRAYRPSAALRRHLVATHGTCRFPGCTRPARDSDIDHSTNYSDRPTATGDGRTDRANLHPLCRRHHNRKTRRRWRVKRHRDGSEPGPHRSASPTPPTPSTTAAATSRASRPSRHRRSSTRARNPTVPVTTDPTSSTNFGCCSPTLSTPPTPTSHSSAEAGCA